MGGLARAAVILLSRACSEAGVGRGGKLTTRNALGGTRPSSKGGPRSATTSRSCVGEGGRMALVLWGFVSNTCVSYGEFPA